MVGHWNGAIRWHGLIHFGKTGSVPQLGAEIAVSLDPLHVQFQHTPDGCHGRIGEPQRIRAVFINDVQWVNHVARGFGHLLALGIADQPVQINRIKGDLIDHGQLHHHHPRNPEKQNILPRDQG